MNKKFVALAIVIIILIAAVAAVFLYEDNKADEKSPLIGEWSVVESTGIDSAGNIDNSIETLENYKILDITEVKENFFSGKYGDQKITGTYLDGRVSFHTVDKSSFLFDGYLEGDAIKFMLTMSEYGDGTFFTHIYSGIFSKDSNYKVEKDSLYPDMNNIDLKLASGIYSSEGKTVDFVGDMSQSLKITEQENGAFKGTMEQVVGDDNVTLDIAGAAYSSADKIFCRFVESNGHVWDMYLNNDATYAVLNNSMISDIGGSEGKTITIERQYVADGAEIPKIDTASLLMGDWVLKKSLQMDENGNVSDAASKLYSMSLLNYSGSIASGSYAFNTAVGCVSAYTYEYPTNGGNICIQMAQQPAGLEEQKYFSIIYGYMTDNGNTLTLMSRSIDLSDNTSLLICNVFEKSDSSSILGNWKFVNGAGGAAYENYKAVSRNSDNYLTKYDLSIETCKNGFIDGKIGDIPFVGTYRDGYLSYNIETDSVTIMASGFLVDGKLYMTMLVGEKNGEKYDGASWYLAYTKTGSSATLNLPKPADLPKDWILVDGNSFNGEDHALSGDKLTITQYDGFRLVGTMEQVVGDSVVEKQIVGYAYAWEDRVLGNVIDDTGNIWAVNAGKDYLRIVAAMESEISGIAGQPVAAERIYTVNGENAPSIKQDIDLTETEWKATYATGILNGEIYLDTSGDCVIKFTAQNGNLVVGTETPSGGITENETFSAYTFSAGDLIGINMLGIGENGHSRSTSSFSPDGKQMYMTVNSFTDSGEQSAEMLIFEKL